MQASLLEILVDPVDKKSLDLEVINQDDDGQIVSGILHGHDEKTYKITNGIPRFVLTEDRGQQQTEKTFGYKWQQEDSYGSPKQRKLMAEWLSEKYGFGSVHDAQEYFQSRESILDAGCGSGYSSSCWLQPKARGDDQLAWVGADISESIDVAQKQLSHINGTHFVQGDVLELPFSDNSFDTIFSEGVLHHTPSTERALKAVVPLLKQGGEILFYVYRKKGAIREFTDDYIRDVISDIPPEDAWEMLRPLTKLGKALADLNVEIDVPEDIPYLGIKAGRIDIQRLVYWNIAKMYWNDEMTFEEAHHINFDWYHPRYAHRQTENQVRQWCDEAGLNIRHFHEQESGYSVRAIKE